MWSHYPWPDRPTERRLLSRVIQAYLDIFAPGRGPGRPPRELSIAQVYHVD